jgi:WD40 repeat protein
VRAFHSFTHFYGIALRCVVFSSAHDNTKFVSSGGDRSVFLWDVTTGNTIRRISAHLAKINVVEFNADASVVASGKSISMLVADGHTPMLTPAQLQVPMTLPSNCGIFGASISSSVMLARVSHWEPIYQFSESTADTSVRRGSRFHSSALCGAVEDHVRFR